MRYTSCIFVGCLSVLASSVVSAAAPAPAPTQKVGNSYVYKDKVATVKCAKWRTVKLDQDGYLVCACGDYTMYRKRPDMSLAKITNGDGTPVVKFDPPAHTLSFPLTEGKKWTGRTEGYTADNNAKWTSDYTCDVAGFEKTATAAGNIGAYRVDCHDQWQSGSYRGVSETSTWYSPKLNEIIKVKDQQDSRWNEELQSYKLVK